MSLNCGSKLQFPWRTHAKGKSVHSPHRKVSKGVESRMFRLQGLLWKLPHQYVTIITTRYNYILPVLRHPKKCTPTSAVALRVMMSKEAHKRWCTRKKNRFDVHWISHFDWPAVCLDLRSTQYNFTLFPLQRPRAAHSLWAHLLTGAQQSAGGGICGDQAATFGNHPGGSDETFHPSATTSSWSCWRYCKGQTWLT